MQVHYRTEAGDRHLPPHRDDSEVVLGRGATCNGGPFLFFFFGGGGGGGRVKGLGFGGGRGLIKFSSLFQGVVRKRARFVFCVGRGGGGGWVGGWSLGLMQKSSGV